MRNIRGPSISYGMIGSIGFFILLLIILYYIYTFLYTSASTQSSINIVPSKVLDQTQVKNASTVRCDAVTSIGTTESAVAQITKATGLTTGGQYSVTMWVSVYGTTPSLSGTDTLQLLDITSSNKTLLYIGLKPINGTLIIRQSTTNEKDGTTGTYGPSTPVPGASPVTTSDKCDILNGIEYQRWILVGVVANGRTLDVYIDGKLSRSCVYLALNDLGVTTGTGQITVGRKTATSGAINGMFSATDYYNYALTPDVMWNIYQNGPSSASTSSVLSGLFNTNIDLSMGTSS